MNRIELIQKITEILDKYSDEPAEEIIKAGKAMMEIGEVLRGKSMTDAKAILEAVRNLNLIRRDDSDEVQLRRERNKT